MTRHIQFYSTNYFSLHHSVVESPEDIATHLHDCYELFYFISGDLTYYIEGQAYKLNPHDMIITNSKELHRIVFNSKAAYERKFIHFKQEYVSSFQSDEYNMLNYIEKRKLGYFNKIEAKDVFDSGIDSQWNSIQKAALENSPESHIIIKTFFVQMLVAINKVFSKNNSPIMDTYDYDKKIVSILEYINKNLDERITLDLLQQNFYVNKYYLCHIFKLNTGFTVLEYITYKRIMKAKELLRDGVSVLDVSQTVGFGDYSNFYKAFKKITGFSPKKYLKQ